MVILAGAADEPVDAMDGQTPLAVARTPHIDDVSSTGRQGRARTIPEGVSAGSDVAIMSLFGYDPRVDAPGRGPLEAAARDVHVEPDQVVFRCNLVTVVDGVLEDPTAGYISQAEADQLIADLNRFAAGSFGRFHTGMSYRNLFVASRSVAAIPACTRPYDVPGKRIHDHLPTGSDAEWIRELTRRSKALLADHEVTLVRGDLGENPATDIWLWGGGTPRSLEPFAERFGIAGAVVAGVDLVRGLARLVGMDVMDVPGATGDLTTDLAAKGRAAAAGLDGHDLVVVHVEAPDQAGHQGDVDAKVDAIERIDEKIVGPVLDKLRSFEAWRLLVAIDHPTSLDRRVHGSAPPPFCMAGEAVHTVMNRPFSEAAAAESDLQIDPGHILMEHFLRP